MLTSAKEKLGSLKRQAQSYAGIGAMVAKALANKDLLLRNSDFRLIHVKEENAGERQSMRIATPAFDRSIRHESGNWDILLYHTFGVLKKSGNHGQITALLDSTGQTVSSEDATRKQDALLHLLRSRPGLWWIDVFCAQSETPPSIMGDVYRYCEQCFALVDFPSVGFQPIEAISARLKSVESVDNLVKIYEERINGKTGSADQSWYESLDDLLGEWYDGDPADIKALADFFGSRWFTRVWTLQEYVLPPAMTFVSESDPDHYYFDRMAITPITDTLCEIASTALKRSLASDTDVSYRDFYLGLSTDQHKHASSTPGLSRCYFDLERFDAFQLYLFYDSGKDIRGTNIMALRYGSSNLDMLILILALIARLPRTCMYTRDYIYGVCGLLDINIPLLDDDEEVWASFRKTVQKRAPYLDIPGASPLPGATNMQDAYKVFTGQDIRAFIAAASEYNSSLPE